jgi:predicted component of type VI protein secretion system
MVVGCDAGEPIGATTGAEAAGAEADAVEGLVIELRMGVRVGFAIFFGAAAVRRAAGFFAATATFALALAFTLAFFLGAARFATFLATLRTTRTFFFTERFLAERVCDARIFAFAIGRFLDFLFFAMVRLLLTGRVDTRV